MIRILLVEDDCDLREFMREELEEHQVHLTEAVDGEQAIRLIAADHFDLVFLDLKMPKADGFSVLANMQKHFLSIPTVVLSNSNSRENVQRSALLGARESILKVEMEEGELWALAKKYLGMRFPLMA